MATLTDVTWMIRKGLVFGSIGSVVFTIIGILIWVGIQNVTTEPPAPTPTPGLAFGALPPIKFPESAKRPSKYELLLIEGSPPPSQYATVYFVPKKAPTLFSRKNAAELATLLGFTQDPVITNTTQYDYSDPTSKNKLTIDIPYKYYTFSSGSVEPKNYMPQVPEDEARLKAAGEGYLNSIGLWSKDLKDIRVRYVEWTGSGFTPQAVNSKTSFARIDFFNPTVSEVPILTAHPSEANVFVIFAFTAPNQRIAVASKYKYYAPDFTINSTYPTISGETAWKQLQEGGGYIAQPVKGGDKASVRRIYLAYFLPDEYQDYLQPVWVFEGDQDFYAMVYAIDPAYVGT